jgi:transposase
VQPWPKLGPWIDELQRLLAENDAQPAGERLDLIGIFEVLRRLGYIGSYDAVRRYARARRRQEGRRAAEAFVPLSFAPGAAYQFDWSEGIVVLNGTTTKVRVAQARLCHGRMAFCVPTHARRKRWCSTCTTGRSPYSLVVTARSIAGFCRCAAPTWWNRRRARRRLAGRRAR